MYWCRNKAFTRTTLLAKISSNAFLDEGLETMCSDGGLLDYRRLSSECSYRWLQKIGTAMECEQKLVNACGRN